MGNDNPFWDYAVELYSKPAMAEQCLALQDQYGIDVNLLLWVIWQASRRVVVDADIITQADQRVMPWRECCVKPMRDIRRQLKTLGAGAELYRQSKALELALEHDQQQRLFAYSQSLKSDFARSASSVVESLHANIRCFLALQPQLPAAQRDRVLSSILALVQA